jgi:hypothetical protein
MSSKSHITVLIGNFSNKELSEEEMKDNTMSGESRMETTTGTP